MALTAEVFGPWLDRVGKAVERAVDVLEAFFKNDRDLRKSQSENEPMANGYQQGSNVNGTDTMVVPSSGAQQAAPFTTFLDGQDTTAKKYSYIVVIIFSTSGAGFYSIQKSIIPTQSGTIGIEIPAGGTVLTIPGVVNIENFKMCPATGATLNYVIQGFE